MFPNLIGNEPIKAYLQTMIAKRAVANSLLFVGIEGIGKGLFAEAFAAALFAAEDPGNSASHAAKVAAGSHPDLTHYRPEGKSGMHSIETMRQFCEQVNLAPYAAPRKVFIIHDAHRMLTYSANALLKTYEEPSEDSIIILLTNRIEALLPTIVSRCRTLRFRAIAESEIAAYLMGSCGATAEQARAAAAEAQGSLDHAVALVKAGGDDPAAEQLIKVLEAGPSLPYHQLVEAVKLLSEQLEQGKEGAEAVIREQFLQGSDQSDLTAHQRQLLQKEVEGAAAMKQSEGAYRLFDLVLYWYRDLHLLYWGGERSLLFHRRSASRLAERALDREPPSLDAVCAAIGEARLSIERATSLSITLENLLLKLSFLW